MSNAQYHSHLHYVQIWHSAPKAPPIFPHPESDRSGIWELLGRECRVTSLTFPLLYCLLCLGSGSLALHNVYSCCHGGPALSRFHSLYREHTAHLQRSARLCRANGNWIRTAQNTTCNHKSHNAFLCNKKQTQNPLCALVDVLEGEILVTSVLWGWTASLSLQLAGEIVTWAPVCCNPNLHVAQMSPATWHWLAWHHYCGITMIFHFVFCYATELHDAFKTRETVKVHISKLLRWLGTTWLWE